MSNLTKLHQILNAAIKKAESPSYVAGATADRLRDFTFHTNGYAEPSYSDPASGVICVGNFNDFREWSLEGKQIVVSDLPSRASKVLEERYGVELEWSDEWTTCGNCQKLVRTQPDSHSWQRYYAHLDEEVVCCGDCVKKDPSAYLESLEGEDNKCVTIKGIDPAAHGYKLFKADLEHGFHPGQAADPRVIAKALRAQGVTRFLFTLDRVQQFDLRFSVYIHEEDWKNLKDPEITTDAVMPFNVRLE